MSARAPPGRPEPASRRRPGTSAAYRSAKPPGERATAAQTIANPFEGDADAIARGKVLYGSMNCVYCHGAGGAGLMGPPLNAHGWRYGGTPAEIFNSIHDGRPKGMPAWGAAPAAARRSGGWSPISNSSAGPCRRPRASMAALGAPEPSDDRTSGRRTGDLRHRRGQPRSR